MKVNIISEAVRFDELMLMNRQAFRLEENISLQHPLWTGGCPTLSGKRNVKRNEWKMKCAIPGKTR
jgi:hypothetical protein